MWIHSCKNTSCYKAQPHKWTEREHFPIGERIAWYQQLKKESAQVYDFGNKGELTMYGYSKYSVLLFPCA
jgi:hypothetical protein